MDGPETVIQSEVSQKEKNKYILMHISWSLGEKMAQMKLFANYK